MAILLLVSKTLTINNFNQFNIIVTNWQIYTLTKWSSKSQIGYILAKLTKKWQTFSSWSIKWYENPLRNASQE